MSPGSSTPYVILVALASAALAGPAVELVETFPVETALDNPDVPEAHEVWIEMIDGAESRLDLAEFYASNEPGSRLEDVVEAVEEAAARGVTVRFLAEKRFYEIYPETLDRLGARENIEVRIFDVKSVMGGVLHAKYFLVDEREAFVGSQNFDWRALTHIQELGVRIRDAAAVRSLRRIFETDWALAAGEDYGGVEAPGGTTQAPAGEEPPLRVVGSPEDWLPEGVGWDLPAIVGVMDGAVETLKVQLLTYRAVGRDGIYFETLEAALRRAAARGVRVRLLVADWSKREGTIEGLQSLQLIPGIEVKFITIPQWSGGFIPFARVAHAKYLVVDGLKAWIGTSNWERSYFHESRNVGLILEGAICGQIDAYFELGWNGPYASAVEPCATYEPPRIAE